MARAASDYRAARRHTTKTIEKPVAGFPDFVTLKRVSVRNKAFEPRYNWTKKVTKDGEPAGPQEITRADRRVDGIYDCHSYGLKTPGRDAEIVQLEAAKAELARQLEEAE